MHADVLQPDQKASAKEKWREKRAAFLVSESCAGVSFCKKNPPVMPLCTQINTPWISATSTCTRALAHFLDGCHEGATGGIQQVMGFPNSGNPFRTGVFVGPKWQGHKSSLPTPIWQVKQSKFDPARTKMSIFERKKFNFEHKFRFLLRGSTTLLD